MKSRARFFARSLPVLLPVCFLSWTLWADDIEVTNWSRTESLKAHNSADFPQDPRPSQAAVPESSVIETGPLFPVVKDGKWGYIDNVGKMVISARYDLAGDFSEGLAAVRSGHKWGYIDKTGQLVIPFEYFNATRFSDGLAPVRRGETRNDKWGYIDKTGQMVIPAQYEIANIFAEGLAAVIYKTHWGYIDKTGQMVISHWNWNFNLQPCTWPGVRVRKDHKFEHLDNVSPMLILLQSCPLARFSEGLTPAPSGHRMDKWGYMDKAGRMAIPMKYDFVLDFTEGLAPVMARAYAFIQKWGFIDKGGEFVIPPQYSATGRFSEGLAAVKVTKKWGFIEKTGQMVIPPQYDSADEFFEGLAAVTLGDKVGYVDKTGKLAIPLQYSSAEGFSHGLAEVQVNRKWGYIDKTGKYVWEPTQ